MKTIAIIQARLGSARFPRKVLKKVNGTSLIEYMLKRLKPSTKLDDIIVATTNKPEDLELISIVNALGFKAESGDEHDVLSRYYQVAKNHNATTVVRLTGDCPLIDVGLVDEAIERFQNTKIDYLCNNYPPTYPDGLDVEIFSFEALENTYKNALSQYEKEHVTPYIRTSNIFSTETIKYPIDHSNLRWTVDEPEDFLLIEKIFNHFYPRIDFEWREVIEFVRQHSDLTEINKQFIRNEGAAMGAGPKMWRRAKRVIPGGGMLLSKRAEMFLPDYWPSYFESTLGCTVTDLDGTKYTDMSLMGVGTNTLGYSNPVVDSAVMSAVSKGNMSTFNCYEEVLLAERLVELHPWAEMVRFARSGGEANAIAVRIARAATGKEKIAFCGYHGWHDWYLSANLSNRHGLDGHLLPGLNPNGVPRGLEGTVLPFSYNNIDELLDLIGNNQIGAIFMEVERNTPPVNNFLQKVREIADRHGIVLIFDECTSGFRETYGGLHKKYNVNPDIAVFGKALGNGYAITAVVGKKSVMDSAQSTFISSTFWTERIGSVAALASLKEMDECQSWDVITAVGLKIKERWDDLAKKYELPISISGLPALASFQLQLSNWLTYKTFITQEMLKMNFLASNAVYTCIDHNDAVLEEYFSILAPIFSKIKDCEEGAKIDKLLIGPVCQAGFRRLN